MTHPILNCGYCGFKGNTKENYACQVCEHDPWWQYIPYKETTNNSALEEFKNLINFEQTRKRKMQASSDYDDNYDE